MVKDAVFFDFNLCAVDFEMVLMFVLFCLTCFQHSLTLKEHELDILSIAFVGSWNFIEEEALSLEAGVDNLVLIKDLSHNKVW